MEADFWNDRYASHDSVYSEAPNDFVAESAGRMPVSGLAIDLGAGEGRNALFLASRGLDTLAVDQSEVGLAKASSLAAARGLALRTMVADLDRFDTDPGTVAVVTSVFVHLPAEIRAPLHARVREWLAPGGVFVLEAFAPEQAARTTGGPSDPARFAPLDTLIGELEGLRIDHGATLTRRLREGPFHDAESPVVQMLATRG